MAKTMTSSYRRGEKLSLRLSFLQNKYHQEKHIWDIGCDHGLLGLSFIEKETVESVNLVDPSVDVIHSLTNKLKDSYITKGKVFIHHQEGQHLTLNHPSNCIFIAGMGGKEIGEIINHLLPQLSEIDRVVISPHRKILELRSKLKALPLQLLEENVLKEDGQFYQILVMRPSLKGEKVSFYGKEIWKSEVGEEYRKHQIKHFETHQDEASHLYVSYLKGL